MNEDNNVMVIYLAGNKHFLTITNDGRTVFGEGFDSDSGAKDFCKAVEEVFGFQQTYLEKDNARLRALIRDVEASDESGKCPWCTGSSGWNDSKKASPNEAFNKTCDAYLRSKT